MLVKRFKEKADFEAAWPDSVAAIAELFETRLTMPDYQYELYHDTLHRTLGRLAANEVERVLRRLWRFDERYFGEVIGGGRSDYQWAVYVLAYLGQDIRTVDLMFKAYLPLLGDHAFREFGRDFCRKVCLTFHDDVGHLVWDVQGAEEPDGGDWFDWHGHLNGFHDDNRASLIEQAGLSPLRHPSFPPFSVLQYMVADPVRMGRPSPRRLRQDLTRQYRGQGYEF